MSDLQKELARLTEGMVYVSETDAPWEPFVWAKGETKRKSTPTPALAREKLEVPPDTPAEVVSFSDFFEPLTVSEDWYGEEEKAEVEQYRRLRSFLGTALNDLKVFKIGKRKLDILAVGRTPEGDLAGIRTKAVET